MQEKTHRAGFVNIIGLPNAGKSTLMNALTGEKLSIVTSKAQTTRHRVMGIVSGEDFQLIYSDTPGFIKPYYAMHKAMIKYIEAAIEDGDVILLVIDASSPQQEEELLSLLQNITVPLLIVINKIDLSDQSNIENIVNQWHERFPKALIIPVSALYKANLDILFKKLISLLPESPPYFPKDELTDRSLRFFVSEIIREKIFLYYQKEIPYCTEVIIEQFLEKEKPIRINAVIYVARETQKGIIIGNKGSAIKKVGIEARKDIENMLGEHIFLDLAVKVSKNWRENPTQLKRFGFKEI